MAEPALPFLAEPGLWIERVGPERDFSRRPALFLDRDGTINKDCGYPKDPRQIVLREQIAPVIRAANDAGMPAVIVTNQSGIARGFLDWNDFAAVNARVLELLAGAGCRIDLVLACAYYGAGEGPLAVADHPMRKPNPGMILRARDLLGVDLARSLIVGDKPADMEAGQRAGLRQGWQIGEADSRTTAGFARRRLASEADHVALAAAIAAFQN